MSFDEPWWTAGMALAWLRTADRDFVNKLETAPQVGSLSFAINSAYAKDRGFRICETHEAAMAALRGKLASGELALYREDASSGELEKIKPEDAKILDVDKNTLTARIPGNGGWSDRFRFKADEILQLWPNRDPTVVEEVGAEQRESDDNVRNSPRSASGYSKAKLLDWYLKCWVPKKEAEGSMPSRIEEWEAAKQEFGGGVPRDAVVKLRRELAPAKWKQRGRRKKIDGGN
jgi:hypothetical protein